MNILIKEENEFKQQLEMVDIGQLKKEKAMKRVFENFEWGRDILYVLRFAAYQWSNIGIEPVDT